MGVGSGAGDTKQLQSGETTVEVAGQLRETVSSPGGPGLVLTSESELAGFQDPLLETGCEQGSSPVVATCGVSKGPSPALAATAGPHHTEGPPRLDHNLSPSLFKTKSPRIQVVL